MHDHGLNFVAALHCKICIVSNIKS